MNQNPATPQASSETCPVFPLNAVLFPAGVLSLRVFEARYVDMVRECMRNDTSFAVCRITQGGEVGEAAEYEPVGCLASIVEWDMEQAGLLLIKAIGGQRVRLGQRTVQRDGLIRANYEVIAVEPDVQVPQEYAACRDLLRKLADDLDSDASASREHPLGRPYQFDSSSWVGNRLCELLPLPLAARQKLMELDNPLVRLSLVQQFLKQRGIV